MGVTAVLAILTNLWCLLRAFCHFVPAHVLAEGFFAKMAISRKTHFLLSPVINEL
jgi:hypothetical protein